MSVCDIERPLSFDRRAHVGLSVSGSLEVNFLRINPRRSKQLPRHASSHDMLVTTGRLAKAIGANLFFFRQPAFTMQLNGPGI
jgi:hypothetical protein